MLAAAWLAGATAYKDGPPAAHTGGFGEPTCRQCHGDAELNESGGAVTLDGAPDAYRLGRTYELVVSLRRAGLLRAGFQIAARFAAGGDSAGRPAGTLAPVDARTKIVRDTVTGIPYLEHTLAGSAAVDSARWVMRWTAPATVRGPVVFHVAANAANDDDSPLGDFIYATVVTSRKPDASARGRLRGQEPGAHHP